VAPRRLRLNRTLGPLVVEWVESELVHGPGDVQGQRIQLDDEQVRFILRCYELDEHGRRLVRRAVFSRSKGRAKSELGAMLVCAEALGPVRFRGWDHDGRPLAGPVQAAYIPVVATEEGQAGNVFEAVEFMLREGPVSRTPGLDVGQTRVFLPDGGRIRPVTARATSKEGGRETFAIFDETHLFVGSELVRLHDTIRRNLSKRRKAEPWSLELSTMYAPGEESVAEMSHRYAESVSGVAARGFLFDHLEAPAELDFNDDEQLRDALTIAYGAAAEWIDLERMLAEARDPQTREPDFRRYFLNQATARSDAWLSPQVWAERSTDVEIDEDTRVVLGFDGSYNGDSTALVGCTVEEEPHLFVVGAWERPEGVAGRDWSVPREAVKAAVDDAMERHTVVELACDPPGWHREIDEWADRYPDTVTTQYATNRRAFMAHACSRFYTAVAAGQLTHDGDARLARHLANAKLKETPDGAYIVKDGRNSPRKIDLAVAAVIAYDRAAWHANKRDEKPKPRWGPAELVYPALGEDAESAAPVKTLMQQEREWLTRDHWQWDPDR
jgi:phage terminase large subunit-like protein